MDCDTINLLTDFFRKSDYVRITFFQAKRKEKIIRTTIKENSPFTKSLHNIQGMFKINIK